MHSTHRKLAVSFIALWVLLRLAPPCALAQPIRELVVIPYGASDTSDAIDAANQIEAAFVDAHASVISMHDARDRFTARSRPPQRLTESELEALSRAAKNAVDQVAFGRTAAAQKSVHEVMTRAERALESLNRETATARKILDACLSMVRSALQTGSRDSALEQGMRCRQLIPDLAPSRASQPAEVVGVMIEADDLLARMRIGHLSVHSTPKQHCAVYLNGRHLGSTPFEFDRAAAGLYRVQVECGDGPARVHLVQLGDQPVNMTVDSELDRAVSSEPRLVLHYDLRESARAVSGAVSLGAEIGADDVVLVAIGASQAELSRVQVRQGRLVGRVTLPWNGPRGFERSALERALEALSEARLEETPSLELEGANDDGAPTLVASESPLEGASNGALDFAKDAHHAGPKLPTAARSAPPTRQSEPIASRRRKLALGITALALSAGLFTAAGVLANERRHAGDELRSLGANFGESYVSAVAAWADTRVEPYVLASVGSGLLTGSAVALLLHSARQGLPRWVTGVSAGLGLALAGWGAFELARGGACPPDTLDRRACSGDLERRDRGALLLLAAAPLLAVSCTQLARRDQQPAKPYGFVLPQLDPVRRTLSLNASIRWY